MPIAREKTVKAYLKKLKCPQGTKLRYTNYKGARRLVWRAWHGGKSCSFSVVEHGYAEAFGMAVKYRSALIGEEPSRSQLVPPDLPDHIHGFITTLRPVALEEQTRLRVEDLYTKAPLSVPEISRVTGVSDSTIERWARACKWKKGVDFGKTKRADIDPALAAKRKVLLRGIPAAGPRQSPEPEKKLCNGCGEELPVVAFNFKNKAKGLRQTKCRRCTRLISAKYDQRNRDRKKKE